MSTITLPNIRVSSDLEIRLKLKDGGVAIDWSTLTNIKASIYSDRQRSLAGRCDIEIDEDDNTILVCRYSANKPQYPGVNRIIVSCTYDGETKTYDKPAFNFVRWTDDQEGQTITIDDPDIDVEISVEDVSSSILQEAVDAANTAAERANEAAEAAEHMVDIHTGPAGKSPYIGENGHWYEWDEETDQYVDTETNAKGDTGETPDITIGTVTTAEPGTPAAATMTGTPEDPVLNLTIPKGAVGATPNFTIGTVTTGEPGTPVVVTLTGTPEAPVLNITIPQGMQGNTGSSVDYPYELVNNLTTNDATKGLSAQQGKVLKDELTQLEHKVNYNDVPVKVHKNLYDKDRRKTGYYIDSSGAEHASSNFWISPYMPVKPNTAYYVSKGTTNTAIGTNACYMAEYDEHLALIGVTAVSAKTLTTTANTRYLRVSGSTVDIMVSEGSSFVALEQYSPINYPVFLEQIADTDMDKVLSTPTMFKDFPGAGGAAVIKRVYLVPGRVYHLFFNNNEWSDSEASSGTYKFNLEKWVNGGYTTIANYSKGADVPKVISFEAETADYYEIGIRADSGTTVSVYILDVTEYDSMLPKSLHIKGNNTGARTTVLKTQIGHTYRLFFLKPNWEKENIGSGNYLFLDDANGTNVFAYGKGYYPDGFQYRDFIAKTETYTLSIRADASEYVDVIFADITELFDNSVTAFNGGYSNLLAILSTLTRKSYGNTSPARFNLVFYSDIHNGAENNQRIADFRNLFAKYFNDVIHGGDSVQDNFSHTNTVAEYGGQSFLNVIGNHDALIAGGGLATGLQCYEKYIAPNVAQWGDVVFPEGAATNGYCYYYKDYTDAKVRLIAVDCMHWDTTQKDWFIATLADAKTNGLSVMCASHYSPDRFPTMISDCTFCTLYSSDVNAGLDSEAEDAVADAITGGLDFICWLFGHTHRDYFVKSHNHPEQYAIGVDKGYGNLASDDCTRLKETRYYDSFDVISVDTKSKILTVMKIGANADSYMRQKNYLVFKYDTHEIISNS